MDSTNQPKHRKDDAARIDVVGAIRDNWRLIMQFGTAAALATAAIGGWYFFFGPTVRTSVSQQFRPTFKGASEGVYPNGLVFGTTDIIAGNVIDQAFDKNSIQVYCSQEDFRSGFYVERRSIAYSILEAEFQGKLTDTRITAVERDRLEADYEAKRAALPLNFYLVFVMPRSCNSIPKSIVGKVLSDVLSVWAEDSESKRGVLKLDVQVLTAGTLDIGPTSESSQLIRCDLARGALMRLVTNIRMVEALPGADLVRYGDKHVTFAEVRNRIEGLIQAKLEPLVISSGRGLGKESVVWAEEALATAGREVKVADGTAKTYLDALREYSGAPAETTRERPDPRATATGSSDVQTLTPQIDRTFIDRIVELSAPNMVFRQELTRSLVSANMEAVRQQANLAHYQRLVDQLKQPGSGESPAAIDARLNEILSEGKDLAQIYNNLYDEFSRVALRASAAMYRLEGPVVVEVIRPYSFNAYLFGVVSAFLIAATLAIAACLVRTRFTASPATP